MKRFFVFSVLFLIMIIEARLFAGIDIYCTNTIMDGMVVNGQVFETNKYLKAGDDQSDRSYYTFLGFPLDQLPPTGTGTVITAATLFYRTGIHKSTNINAILPILFSHLDFGPWIDTSDTNCTLIETNFYTLYSPIEADYQAIPCTAQVSYAYTNYKNWTLTGPGSSQWFQIRIQASNRAINGTNDYIQFRSHDYGGQYTPFLRVYWLNTECSNKDVVLYVDKNGSHIPPYDTLATASTNIQTAIDYISTASCNNNDLVAQNTRPIVYINTGIYDEQVIVDDLWTTGPNNYITIRNVPGAHPHIVSNNIIMREDYTVLQGITVSDYYSPDETTYENNTIACMGNNITVRSCVAYHLSANPSIRAVYKNAIYFHDTTTNGIAEYNYVYDCNNTQAFSGIRQRGANGIIRNNKVENMTYAGIVSSYSGATGSQFCYNYINNCGNGILIRNVSDEDIYNNLITHCPKGIYLLAKTSDNSGVVNNVRVYNNTIYGTNYVTNNQYGIIFDDNSGQDTLHNASIFNNLVFDIRDYGIWNIGSSVTFSNPNSPDYNFVYNCPSGVQNLSSWGTHNITNQNPLFLSLVESDPNFLRVQTTSPVIDQGADPSTYISVNYATNDYWAQSRPYDMPVANQISAYDIGADEVYGGIYLTKVVESISLNGSTGTNNAYPGALITYKAVYSNINPSGALNGVYIKDVIPSGLQYKTGSLKSGTSSDTYSSASSPLTDKSGDDIGFYTNSFFLGEFIAITPPSGLAPDTLDNLPLSSAGAFFFQGYIQDSIVGGNDIINFTISTGDNFPTETSADAVVSVVTQYGGSFNFLPDIGGIIGTNWIPVFLTNKGNINTTYDLSIPYTAYSAGDSGKFTIEIFDGAKTAVISSVTVSPKAVTNFYVRIIAQSSLNNGDYIDFRILADTHSSATNYIGEDGILYGGDIGLDQTGTMSVPGQIYQQNNSEIRMTIQIMDIRIRKTQISPIGNAVVGQEIRYRIDYTNAGGVNAFGVKIIDPIPFGTEYKNDSLFLDGFGALTDDFGDDAGTYLVSSNTVVFTVNGGVAPDTAGSIAPGEFGSVYFSVIVKSSNIVSHPEAQVNLTTGFDAEVRENISIDNTLFEVGDRSFGDDELRGILSLQMSMFLTNEKISITTATLFLRTDGAFVGDDIATINPLSIDLANLGPTPDDVDYNAPVYISNMVSFNPAVADTIYPIVVTSGVLETINNKRINFQIKIRPNGITADGGKDAWAFSDLESANKPIVHIWYHTNDVFQPPEFVTNNVSMIGDNFTTLTTNAITKLTQVSLTISKTTSPVIANAQYGDYIRYKIDYANNSGFPISGVKIIDTLPFGTEFSNGSMYDSMSLSDGSGDDAGYFDGTDEIVYCPNGTAPDTGGTLSDGDSGSFYYTVKVLTNVLPEPVTTNSLTLTYTDGDLDRSFKGPAYNQRALNETPLRLYDANANAWRAVIGVDISTIPVNVTIVSATQYIYIDGFNNQPNEVEPYSVDYISLSKADISVNANATNWGGGVIIPHTATFNTPPSTLVYFGYPVTTALQNALTNSSLVIANTFQQRLTQTPNGDGNIDGFRFASAEDSAHKPYLSVHYYTNKPAPTLPTAITNIVMIQGDGTSSVTNSLVITIASQSPPPTVNFVITKSVSNITLQGVSSKAIPGSTITYVIQFSNTSANSGVNVLVYDKLQTNVVFDSASQKTGTTGWTTEYSIIANPDQSYNSGDFGGMPGDKSTIKWIRWKKSSIVGNEVGEFIIKVIVK